MGLHGWIALGLTVVGVTALNVGLMHLARRRWDHSFERLETAEPEEAAGDREAPSGRTAGRDGAPPDGRR